MPSSPPGRTRTSSPCSPPPGPAGSPSSPSAGARASWAGSGPIAGARSGVVAISFDRMAELLDVDAVSGTARVQPGMTGPVLERLLAARGLTWGHVPQSWERASIGGYAATRSAGQSSTGYGRSDATVEAMVVATPRGTLRLGRAPSSAAGPGPARPVPGQRGRPGRHHRGHAAGAPGALDPLVRGRHAARPRRGPRGVPRARPVPGLRRRHAPVGPGRDPGDDAHERADGAHRQRDGGLPEGPRA